MLKANTEKVEKQDVCAWDFSFRWDNILMDWIVVVKYLSSSLR